MIVASPHCGLRRDSVLGGEIYERELLTRLPQHEIELEIGLPRTRAVAPAPGWRVTLLRPGRWLRWYIAPLAFVPFVVRMLRSQRVSLLRGHDVRFTGPSLLLARLLARKQTPIVLHHLHTDPVWRLVDAWILRRADAIITISQHSRRQLLNAGVDARRIVVVFPGISVPEPLPEPWVAAWPEAAVRLLYLGRLIRRKRPDLAVRALACAVGAGTDASLVLAGSGTLERSLRGLASELGVSDRIAFLGAVDDETKWSLLRAADVFLFPSTLEGFGFSAAEAQALGVPVVCNAGTSAAEIVIDGATGYAVAGKAWAYADVIRRLADPGLRRSFGEAARVAARRFDWDASAAAVAAAYERVAATSGRPRWPCARPPARRGPTRLSAERTGRRRS